MSADTARNLAWKLNWFRQSELEGALLLGRMVGTIGDRTLAARLTKHCAEEAEHSRLWSEVIAELGLPHVRIFRSYQSLYLRHGGAPSTLLDVLAFTQIFERRVSCCEQSRTKACDQSRTLNWSGAMEEKDGAFVLGRRGEEDGVIAVGMDAAGDEGARRFFDAQALCGDGDAAVRADARLRAGAPDVRPPRAARGGAQHGTLFLAGAIPCGLRSGADLAVLFLGVVVGAQFFDPEVGLGQRGDVLRGEECGEPFLPEVVGAFDFALGLRGGCVAQGDFVEAQGGAELGEGVRRVGEEEGMVVHVEGQGQAAGEEGAGEEVEMGEEGFARVESGQWQKAAVIIDEFEHRGLLGLRGQPAMWRGVVLPELADLLDLPAAHRLERLLVAGVRGEVVGQRPAAHGGAIQSQGVAAVNFRSGKAVGGRRLGTEQLAQQGEHGGWPHRALVATGATRLPLVLAAQCTEGQVAGIKHVEAASAHAEFRGGVSGGDGLCAEAGEDIANERSRMAAAQLSVDFSSASIPEKGAHAFAAPPSLRSGGAANALSCFAAQLVLLCLPAVLL